MEAVRLLMNDTAANYNDIVDEENSAIVVENENGIGSPSIFPDTVCKGNVLQEIPFQTKDDTIKSIAAIALAEKKKDTIGKPSIRQTAVISIPKDHISHQLSVSNLRQKQGKSALSSPIKKSSNGSPIQLVGKDKGASKAELLQMFADSDDDSVVEEIQEENQLTTKTEEMELAVNTEEKQLNLNTEEMQLNLNMEERQLNLNTEERQLNLNTEEMKLNLNTEERQLNLNTEEMQLNLNTEEMQLNLNTEERQLNLNTEQRQLNLNTEEMQLNLNTEEMQLNLNMEERQLNLNTEEMKLNLNTEEMQLNLNTEQRQLNLNTEEMQLNLNTEEMQLNLNTEQRQLNLNTEEMQLNLNTEEMQLIVNNKEKKINTGEVLICNEIEPHLQLNNTKDINNDMLEQFREDEEKQNVSVVNPETETSINMNEEINEVIAALVIENTCNNLTQEQITQSGNERVNSSSPLSNDTVHDNLSDSKNIAESIVQNGISGDQKIVFSDNSQLKADQSELLSVANNEDIITKETDCRKDGISPDKIFIISTLNVLELEIPPMLSDEEMLVSCTKEQEDDRQGDLRASRYI